LLVVAEVSRILRRAAVLRFSRRKFGEVHAAIERFKAAGVETSIEEETTCCYAVQGKVQVVDPDGQKWEVFVVLEADVKDELYAQAGCCGPETVTLNACSDSADATSD